MSYYETMIAFNYAIAPYVTAIFVLFFLMILLMIPTAIRKIRLGLNKDKFECQMCGNCCRFGIINISDEDIKRIESHGYKDFWEIKDGEKVFKKVNGRCVFNKNDKCTIQEFKGELCRKFPFFTIYRYIPYCYDWKSCVGVEKLKRELGMIK